MLLIQMKSDSGHRKRRVKPGLDRLPILQPQIAQQICNRRGLHNIHIS